MNPLLFADWGRLNRLFTRLMWTVVVVLMFAVGVALAGAGSTPRHRDTSPVTSAMRPAVIVSVVKGDSRSTR